MASEVDISNLALNHLGEDGSVSSLDPPDGSAHADRCAIFYPQARDVCLQAHNWKFAKRTVQLTEPMGYAVDGWLYTYAVPSDCLKVTLVYPQGYRRDTNQLFQLPDFPSYPLSAFAGQLTEFDTEVDDQGNAILLTDVENPYLIYTMAIEDTSKFPPMFTTALSYLLASMLAGPVLKGDVGMAANKYWLQIWQQFVSTAATLDSMNQRVRDDRTPSNITARL